MLEKMRKFVKRNDKTGKKRQGFTLVELMVAMSIVILLSAAAFFAYSHVQQMRKMAQVSTEMDAIANACLTYESLNKKGELPADLAALEAGLDATNTIDGIAHKGLLQSGAANKSTSGTTTTVAIKDPWDQAYVYSKTARSISCTPKDAAGTAMSTIVKTF